MLRPKHLMMNEEHLNIRCISSLKNNGVWCSRILFFVEDPPKKICIYIYMCVCAYVCMCMYVCLTLSLSLSLSLSPYLCKCVFVKDGLVLITDYRISMICRRDIICGDIISSEIISQLSLQVVSVIIIFDYQ